MRLTHSKYCSYAFMQMYMLQQTHLQSYRLPKIEHGGIQLHFSLIMLLIEILLLLGGKETMDNHYVNKKVISQVMMVNSSFKKDTINYSSISIYTLLLLLSLLSNEALQYLYRVLKALRMLDHVKIALLDSFKLQFYAPFLGLVISPERTRLAYVLMVYLEYLWGGNAIEGHHSKVSNGGAQVQCHLTTL